MTELKSSEFSKEGQKASDLPKKEALTIVKKANRCKLFRGFEGRKCICCAERKD